MSNEVRDVSLEEKKIPKLHDVSDVIELRKMLRSGVNINETNSFEETPLLCALRREGDLQLIQEFLNHGADVNAKDCWGVSPLYCAVARHGNNLDLIRVLLDHGGDIKSGKRPNDRFLDHTVTHKNSCAKLLIKYKFLRNYELVENLKSNSDPNTRDYYIEYKDIVDLDLKPSCYKYLASYLDKCTSEVVRMKAILLNTNLSLLDFISTKQPLEAFTEQQKKLVTHKIYGELTHSNYYVYKDLIIEKIGRDNLLSKLDEKVLYRKSSISKQCAKKKIILNLDLMYYVSKYLSDEDLLNVVIAFFY